LHEADVGISVDSAVDVAREAADLILLERGLAVLHEGLMEGRRTYANVMKYIMMATSSNFGNMVSLAAASLFLPFLPMLPVQILLNNLLYDTSELALPLDQVDPEDVVHPRVWDAAFIRRFMLTFGSLSSLFDLIAFAMLLWVFQAGPALFRTGWFFESIATQVLVIFVIRTRMHFWRSAPHPWLLAAAITVVVVAAILPYTPLGSMLGFQAPPLTLLGVMALLVVAYLACAEGVKRWFWRAYP
jgi:Mg2+-importing ATPase